MTETLMLTIEETARELRMSRSWVCQRIAAGDIPSVKVGRKRRIRRHELEAYIKGLPTETAST